MLYFKYLSGAKVEIKTNTLPLAISQAKGILRSAYNIEVPKEKYYLQIVNDKDKTLRYLSIDKKGNLICNM